MSDHSQSSDNQPGSADPAAKRFDGPPRSLFNHLLEAVLEQVAEPKQDLEQNLKSALSKVFKRYDMVTREEFEQQQQNLKQAQAALKELKSQLDEISA